MKFVDHAAVADQRMRAATAALRAYAGTEMYEHMLALLEAMKVGYMHDLIDVKPELLLERQGAARQVIALQRALTSEHSESPRI